MADPQVATKLTPTQWGNQYRAENPNYFRYKDITDPAEFADAMRSVKDIEDIVDFSKYDMEMTPTGSLTSKIPVIGGVVDAALNFGTRKPESIMVDGEETAVGAHIFGDDSKAVYGGQRFISGIPAFLSGVVAGGFDEQSAYSMVTESIKKDGNGNNLVDKNGMMDWVDGNGDIHKVTKDQMLERADKLRNNTFLPFGIGPNWKESEEWLVNKTIDFWSEHNKRQDEYLINNPGVQGYLQWQEETPFSYEDHGVRQFVHPQMIARAVADMLPSMTVGTLLGGAPGAVRQTFKTVIGQQTVKQGLKNLTVGGFAQVGGMTLMEGSGQMEESLNILVNELKMDPGQAVPIAASTALVVGIINGLLEKLQFTKIAKYGAFDDKAKTLLTSTVLRRFYDNAMKAGGVSKWMSKGGEFLIDNVEEGVIEAMQEINGLAMSNALESGNAATPEEAMDLYHRQFTNMENMKEMAGSPEAAQAFFTGFSGAGGMSLGTKGLSRALGGKEQVTIGVDKNPTDGKPGFMVNIGGKLSKIFTSSEKAAVETVDILQAEVETGGYAVPGLNKNIEDISTLDELLIALADQASDGELGNVADIWKKGTGGKSLDHGDLTDAQIIMDTISRDNSSEGPKFVTSSAIQMVIDKGGIELLDKIEDPAIRATIIANLREKFIAKVNSDIEGDVAVDDKATEYMNQFLKDDNTFVNVYKDETKFAKDLNDFLSNNVDEGTVYQSSKPVGQTEQDKIDTARERRERVKEIFLEPNKGWDVKHLIEAAGEAFNLSGNAREGINALKRFLGGTKGSQKKPGYKGLTVKNLKALMNAYGLKHTGMKRPELVSALVKVMAKNAIKEIEIQTSQKKVPLKKEADTRPTKDKMGDFFGEEESDPIADEAATIQAEIDKYEGIIEDITYDPNAPPGGKATIAKLNMAIGGLRGKLKQLSLGATIEEKEVSKEVKEEATEETVKTDTGESIVIETTGEGITPESAINKGLDMISAEDATSFAEDSAQELNEDEYNDDSATESDEIINNCGRVI